jgi:hypothetical protein
MYLFQPNLHPISLQKANGKISWMDDKDVAGLLPSEGNEGESG